jgi:hypothetical protein
MIFTIWVIIMFFLWFNPFNWPGLLITLMWVLFIFETIMDTCQFIWKIFKD